MRIVHVGNMNPLEIVGGVEMTSMEVCRRLAEAGHDVTLFCFSRLRDSDTQVREGFRMVSFNSPVYFYELPIPVTMMLGRFFRSVRDADIVHVQFPSAIGVMLAVLASRFYGKPMVFTLQNLVGVDVTSECRGLFYKPAVWLFNRLFLKSGLAHASSITTPSPGFLSNSEYTRGYEDVCETVPNGVDADVFNADADGSGVKERFGLDGRVVLFAANLNPDIESKGLIDLIDAFKGLKGMDGFDDVKLLVVGDGEVRGDYEDYAGKTGFAGDIVFAGRVLNEDMPQYYAACSVFVMPTYRLESFGIVFAEAMACGKPVVGTSMGGVPYVVGDAGIIVSPRDVEGIRDALIRILSDGDYASELGSKARSRVEEFFCWSRIADQYAGVYERILGGKAF
ncbi:MAG: glycosyltransferase family 4 protein [Candidatus Altiarchaeota archaeon]